MTQLDVHNASDFSFFVVKYTKSPNISIPALKGYDKNKSIKGLRIVVVGIPEEEKGE